MGNLKCGNLVFNFIVGRVLTICFPMKSLNNIEKGSSINLDSGFMSEVRILIVMIRIENKEKIVMIGQFSHDLIMNGRYISFMAGR